MASEVVMPRLSDSMAEGTVVRWLVAAGEPVASGQELVEIETDKATVTHEADVDGVLLAMLADEGATVPLGAPIAVIGAVGEQLPQTPAPAGTPSAAAGPSASAAGASAAPGRVAATPVARRLAREHGIDLRTVAGGGPRGRIVKRDVLAAVPPDAASQATAATAPTPAPTRVPLTRMQRTIAERMVAARTSVPDFDLTVEVDMRACVALRDQLKSAGAEPAPSFNDIVVKAVACALREHPRVNGSFADGTFAPHDRVNVGIAVAADDALLVPTVFDADTLSLGAIARRTRALAASVREGAVTPAELEGGTFTVSNLGMLGVDRFTAVVNPPQAAILAVGALRRRPIALADDQVAVAPTTHLTLACDHRIIYGADGARFLALVRELLEAPLMLLL